MCVANEGPTPSRHSPIEQEVTSAWKDKWMDTARKVKPRW